MFHKHNKMSGHNYISYREDEHGIKFEGNDMFSKIHDNQLVDTTYHDEVKKVLENKIKSLHDNHGKKIDPNKH